VDVRGGRAGPEIRLASAVHPPAARGRKIIAERTVLLGGRSLSLPFRGRPLFLCGEAPAVGAAGGFGCSAAGGFGCKTLCQQVCELGEGNLAVAQLRAPLGGGNADHPGGYSSVETREQHQPLAVGKGRGVPNVPRELDAAVRGVDVLSSWP